MIIRSRPSVLSSPLLFFRSREDYEYSFALSCQFSVILFRVTSLHIRFSQIFYLVSFFCPSLSFLAVVFLFRASLVFSSFFLFPFCRSLCLSNSAGQDAPVSWAFWTSRSLGPAGPFGLVGAVGSPRALPWLLVSCGVSSGPCAPGTFSFCPCLSFFLSFFLVFFCFVSVSFFLSFFLSVFLSFCLSFSFLFAFFVFYRLRLCLCSCGCFSYFLCVSPLSSMRSRAKY
jgi:hypothetical protein